MANSADPDQTLPDYTICSGLSVHIFGVNGVFQALLNLELSDTQFKLENVGHTLISNTYTV